jgi:hypothetical protein
MAASSANAPSHQTVWNLTTTAVAARGASRFTRGRTMVTRTRRPTGWRDIGPVPTQ